MLIKFRLMAIRSLLAVSSLGFSVLFTSCGGAQLSDTTGSKKDLRKADQPGSPIELSGRGDGVFHSNQDCSKFGLTDGYGSKSQPVPDDQAQKPASGYGKKPCPPGPVPPAPVPPAPVPPAPPVPAPQPPSDKASFPLSLLTGLVCKKTPNELYNLAQFVGSQSKDQFQFLINAGITGSLTIDQLVIYGQIAKSLSVQQISDWKSRVCVGDQPIAECRIPANGSLPENLAKCLPLPPQVGKLDEPQGQGLNPTPSIDDSGKS